MARHTGTNLVKLVIRWQAWQPRFAVRRADAAGFPDVLRFSISAG